MQRTSILFIGHDLKFLTHVISHYEANPDYRVETKTYAGHLLPEPLKMMKGLERYDLIFCEWGLGNLAWFSHNKIPGQKLITRIHLQELNTEFLADTNWENVDKAIVVGPLMKEKLLDKIPDCRNKCVVIPNLIDTKAFNLEKDPDARFHLGLLGILPMRKSPHLAVEILQSLRQKDQRFKLLIKSKRPEELPWLWKRPEEQTYYNAFYQRIKDEGLEESVIFDSHGEDVPQWFRKVGFIISPSEFESFHMAIAEGMASGAIPVIRNWEGSRALFPEKLIFENPDQAVQMILQNQDEQTFTDLTQELKQFCKKHFSLETILPEYDKIMTVRTEGEKLSKEYYKLLVLRKKLASELINRELELEKARLVFDQFHTLEDRYQVLEENYLEERRKNIELVRKYKENNDKYRVLNEKFNVLVQQQRELNKEKEVLKKELRKMTTDYHYQKDKAGELKVRLNEITALHKQTTRQLRDMKESLSWKVGSALVATPGKVIRKIKGKS